MAPKNKKKNSFYFFMKEMQEREAARGCRISMTTLPNIAHPKWAQMSIEEREPYEELARKHKNDPCLRRGKLASDGTRIEDNLREEQEKELKENAMKQAIKTHVNLDCISDEQFKEFASKKLFYFISFNILCQTDDGYVPNEVGIVEYSVRHGIHREYHMLIHPGQIPTGYTGQAKRLSEEMHGIDIFGEKGSERNLLTVYRDIHEFVNPRGEEFPPLFSVEEDIEQTRGCLEWLAFKARCRDNFEIWNSKYLLMELRAGAGHPFPSPIIAADLLNKTSFHYHPAARCSFHDDKDIHHCALAYSKRLCYLLSDATCTLFDVAITDKHMPTRAVEDKEYVVTMFNDSSRYKKSPFPSSIRLDQSCNYYQSEESEDQFSNAQTAVPEVRSAPRQPRQPSTTCIAAEMSRLRLNISAATVPGHGIGRGQRWNT